MSDPMDMVREFHEAFGVPVRTSPDVAVAESQLRLDLIDEEYAELQHAVEVGDVVETADALADLVYVIYGAALTFGINLPAVLAEVHRTNMAKLAPDGKAKYRDDGKVLKPEGWTAPDIAAVLA